MTDIEDLKMAFRVTDANDTEGHLSEQQWEGLACGELDPGNLEAALDHILGCRRCTEIHQSLLVLRTHAHEFDPDAPVPVITRKPTRRGWVLSGLLTVAATLVVIIFRPLGPGLIGPESAPSVDPILRSSQQLQTATPLSPIGQISTSNVIFSWEPSPMASASVVQLIDERGEVVWTSQETEQSSIKWPSDLAKQPGRYYWRLLSLGGAAGGKQASALVAFDLTESPP